MDPDGLSILIATASTSGALAAAYRAGAVSASEPERQQSGILGFSDRHRPGFARRLCLRADFLFTAFFAVCTGCAWWTLLCLAALAALAVLLFSLGRAKGRVKEKAASRPPVAGCAAGRSRQAGVQALGLSAQPT